MQWAIAAVIVVVLGLVAVAGTGAFGGQRREPVRDVYRRPLPDQTLTSDDLDQVRFAVTVRGYAMGQVDDLLDRLRDDLAVLETEIAELRAGGAVLAARAEAVIDQYGLDGGQGVPQDPDWTDGDGRVGETVEEADTGEFVQYPRSAGVAERALENASVAGQSAQEDCDEE